MAHAPRGHAAAFAFVAERPPGVALPTMGWNQLTVDESDRMISEDPARFKALVQESLRRHCAAVNQMSDIGMQFWDYGNSFLLEASRAGADIAADTPSGFRYPCVKSACCAGSAAPPPRRTQRSFTGKQPGAMPTPIYS